MTNKQKVVHSDPDILGGVPVFVGTRVPVRTLHDYLDGGEPLEAFLDHFPSVSHEQALQVMVREIDWERLFAFLGYGPSSTPEVLFLGLEEKSVDGVRGLRVRSTFAEIEDLRDAHERLGGAGCSNPFAAAGDPVNVWNAAARFALALEGEPHWGQQGMWGAYWRRRLGRHNGTTFLMECFPIPRKNRGNPIPGYPKYTDEVAWQKRRAVLARYFALHKPGTVIAYGEPTRAAIEELLCIDHDTWQSVREVGHPASVVRVGETRVAHVGFFGQGCFNNKDIPTIVRALQAL